MKKDKKKESAFQLPSLSKRKYEEEVTIDLNTTITKQEREYKDFIRNEVESEARNLQDALTLHAAKCAIGSMVYLFPGIGQPMRSATATYFGLGFAVDLYQLLRKTPPSKKKSIFSPIVSGLETLCMLCLLLLDHKAGLKLAIPCYLLFSMLGMMLSCLEFSESIDEVFNLKIVIYPLTRLQYCLGYYSLFNFC